MSKKNRARIIIPCKFGYLNCWRPGVQYGGGPKYSVSAIIPKNDTETIDKIHQAIEFAKENSIQKWGGRIPNNLRSPIHDGDEEKPDNPIYQNCYYINAKSKDAPQVVDENVEPIIDQTQVYSGCSGKKDQRGSDFGRFHAGVQRHGYWFCQSNTGGNAGGTTLSDRCAESGR